jgi:hypothetical protein
VELQRQRFPALCQFEVDRRDGGSGSMLDRQGKLVAEAAEIEVGVSPSVELGGAAQCLTGADSAAALFCVVHEEHR